MMAFPMPSSAKESTIKMLVNKASSPRYSFPKK